MVWRKVGKDGFAVEAAAVDFAFGEFFRSELVSLVAA